jgi:hypothetical protein
MSDTTFVDFNTPAITAAWLNAVNAMRFKSGTGAGADLLNFIQAGAGAMIRSLQARGREVIYSSDFTGDAYTRITAAIAEAKTRVTPHLVIESGLLNIGDNTLTFDVPEGTRITFLGALTSTAANKPAVRFGQTGSFTFYLKIENVRVYRSSNDYTGSSVGVDMMNLGFSEIELTQIVGFREGWLGHGWGTSAVSPRGFTYNRVFLGQIHDNRTNGLIRVSNPLLGGYANENEFFGGSFNHSSGYDVATYNGVNLEVEYNSTNAPNNNHFYSPSFEDGHPSSTNTVAAILRGTNNVIVTPRMERPAGESTYLIKFTPDALECRVDGGGFSLSDSNIENLGMNSKYETRNGKFGSYQTPSGAGSAAQTLMSSSSSDARLLRFLDVGSVERAYITGAGLIYARNLSLDNLGSYASEALAIAGGVPLHGLYWNTAVNAVAQRRTP